MPKYFLMERKNGILTLTINYPAKRNMMNEEMGVEFAGICGKLAGDESLRAMVLTGAGNAFCAGGDLEWLLEKAKKPREENRVEMVSFYKLFLKVRDIEAPVIAAINGPAIGAGMALAMACDIRLASRSARIGATFVKLGLNPGMGSTWLLPRLLGPQRAMLLLATGRIVGADEAYRLGIVEAVYENGALLGEAFKLAEEFSSVGPLAVRWTKRTIWRGINNNLNDHLQDEALGQADCYSTQDFKEGIVATKQKRSPKFIGK